MLNSLTPQQESRLSQIRDEWIQIGLSCEPVDLPNAKLAIAKTYKAARLSPPEIFIVLDSPIAGLVGACLLDQQVGSQVGSQVELHYDNILWGSHSAGWLSFYQTMYELGIDVSPLRGQIDLCKYCGWWMPYKNIAILQHRHCELHRNSRGECHKDGGMAIKYRDGWGIYVLNGVSVSQYLAETPSEQLDPQMIFQENNVQIRREIVRKIGVERLVYKLTAVTIAKSGNYELLEIPIGNNQSAIALKMLNPSVPELWHIEFVDDQCKTVQEALNFRNRLTPDMIDDVNGAQWSQQGDVIIRPKDAKKFRSSPTILT